MISRCYPFTRDLLKHLPLEELCEESLGKMDSVLDCGDFEVLHHFPHHRQQQHATDLVIVDNLLDLVTVL